ncbi:MAG TPA: MerR family transcriptional regulator [Vicinamibacterales bacterium]|jgi:DNA-binding transcriptional MerR regulator|nr:MerR family transcriptional regulator [Vicinamibacterales bacterium]
MPVPRTYRVADVARISGVSIRALHHYDAIGLLVPTGRTEAGYRLYTDKDLLRLQQIAIGRELGFSLEEIKQSLDDPRFDQRQALVEQRQRLEAKARALDDMLRAVDAALAVVGDDPQGGTMEMKELFGGFDPAAHEAEVEQRWGGPALEESKRRVKKYTADDWKRQQTEAGTIYADAAALMQKGVDPTSPAAVAVAERHRLSIDEWFYPCNHAMHAGLADMYEADERFRASIDKAGDGLTTFLAAAIRANAQR